MKLSTALVRFVVLSIPLLFICGCAVVETGTPKPANATYVASAGEAVWSKDGTVLFYYYGKKNDKTGLRSYNVVNGTKKTYNIDDLPSAQYDISPDSKWVVYGQNENMTYKHTVYRQNLETGEKKAIVRLPMCWSVETYWLPNNTIIYIPKPWNRSERHVYAVKPDGKEKRELLDGIFGELFLSADGSTFLYKDMRQRYQIYDFAARSSTPVTAPDFRRRLTITPMHLSKQKLVYDNTRPTLVDLRTMKTTAITLQHDAGYSYGTISPDLRRYWISGPTSHYEPISLYFRPLPKAIAGKIR